MNIIHPKIDDYLDRTLASNDPILREMEAYGRKRKFPIIGPQVGRLLYLLARSIGAKRVLELGSGYGYSAMWFAHAIGADGIVVMTEGDANNSERARDYFQRAGLTHRARFLVGNAFDLVQQLDYGAQEDRDEASGRSEKTRGPAPQHRADALPAASELGPFDIIFCDVDKEDYPRALDVVRPRLRVGGLFICDNMLWSGAVLDKRPSASTRGVVELTRRLTSAPDFFATIVPIRDGVAVAHKIR